MISFLIIAVSVGLIAYGVLDYFEGRVSARRRFALAAGLYNRSASSFNKQKMIAKINSMSRKKGAATVSLGSLLVRAGLDYPAHRVRFLIGAIAAMMAFVMFIVTQSIPVGVIFGSFAFLVIPRIVLQFLIARRENAFLEELPNALDIISRGLKAGMTMGACLKQIVESVKDPVRTEFAYVVDLQKLGMPLYEAMRKMPDRVDLIEVRFFSIVIEIQQKTGGNLSEIISNISAVIRGRREMEAKIRALVAEAKVSSIIISLIPLGFAAAGYASDPEAYSQFVTQPIGRILLGVSIILYLGGGLIFLKLANPKI